MILPKPLSVIWNLIAIGLLVKAPSLDVKRSGTGPLTDGGRVKGVGLKNL